MNSILIIAHTPLASALRSAALHVFPDAASRIDAIDVLPNQATEHTLLLANQKIALSQKSKTITGTLVLSDVLGATPCNVAQKLVDGTHVRCVAGASLPMLLRSITYAHEALPLMADRALAGASMGAVAVS
jgi:mannose PTS system EIIA component